jgi:hypothetical protein
MRIKVMRRMLLSIAVAAAWLGLAVHAHHAISTVYDETQPVTLDGVVTQFQFVNPHPVIVMAVKGEDGKTLQWRLEMDTHRELVEIGFTPETLKEGDRLVVAGARARRQARSLYIRKLDRPSDGFSYEQVGTTPVIRTPARAPSTGRQP